MKASNVIEINEVDDYNKTDLKAYHHLIGKLIYLSCSTRTDIAFAFRQLSKRNVNPWIGHLRVAKQVVQYLKSTIHLRITYEVSNIDLRSYKLVEYVNSNYASDLKDRKSVMGHYFFFDHIVISWCNKKQQTVSTSITRAKYIALDYIAKDSI